MKANKPSIAMAAVLAGSIGCTNQPEAKNPSDCDPRDLSNMTVVSAEPDRVEYKVCDTTYVSTGKRSRIKVEAVMKRPSIEAESKSPGVSAEQKKIEVEAHQHKPNTP